MNIYSPGESPGLAEQYMPVIDVRSMTDLDDSESIELILFGDPNCTPPNRREAWDSWAAGDKVVGRQEPLKLFPATPAKGASRPTSGTTTDRIWISSGITKIHSVYGP